MWWKVLLLLLYLAVLFVMSRVLETVAFYEGGYLASRLLDPVSLSVKRLRTLLDQRGLNHAGAIEKPELTRMVQASGDVTEGELEAASLADDVTATTNFTCGGHFYEEVEDTKDSVWVVLVVNDNHPPHAVGRDNWEMLVELVSRFGVRTGVFDCSRDRRLCERKGWYSSRLVLALPLGYRAKDSVMLHSYTGSTRTQAVFDWVNMNLASRIRDIKYEADFKKWFVFSKEQDKNYAKLRVILFSTMKIPPMFYSVLSVKFTGRVKFGTVNLNTKEGRALAEEMGFDPTKPKYLVLTPENNYTFGLQSGEYLNYHSLGLFLRTLHPEVNDIFLLTLILVNVMCWFELFISSGSLFKRVGALLWYIGKWNILLILLWLPVLGLFQFPYMGTLLEYSLKLLRLLGTTYFASWVRSDWLWYTSISCSFLVSSFLTYAGLVGAVSYLTHTPDRDTNNNATSFWDFHWDTYLSYLFRPMATLRPMTSPDLDLEVGMELLIERLAVPNFWLRPMISPQYIHDLPVWAYAGPSVDSDVGSDLDTPPGPCPGGESDADEEAGPSNDVVNPDDTPGNQQRPLMFVCEKCRLLQNDDDNKRKSVQELERERLESESACAKFLMDGDYKCMCGSGGDHGTTRKSPKKERYKTVASKPGRVCGRGENFMPAGMIASTECAICLEGYKYSVQLCGLPCRHSFHQQCIVGWLSRDNHCCPVCRWPAYKAKPCSIHLHSE